MPVESVGNSDSHVSLYSPERKQWSGQNKTTNQVGVNTLKQNENVMTSREIKPIQASKMESCTGMIKSLAKLVGVVAFSSLLMVSVFSGNFVIAGGLLALLSVVLDADTSDENVKEKLSNPPKDLNELKKSLENGSEKAKALLNNPEFEERYEHLQSYSDFSTIQSQLELLNFLRWVKTEMNQ